jgi:protein gp37
MAGPSNIEWTDATWNPIVGCSIVSPGCTNCYAMRMAARIIAMAGTRNVGVHYDKTIKDVKGKPVWTGIVKQAPDHILSEPLHRRKPTTYFVNSMGDLFHEDCPDEWIDRVFAIMALCPQHTFQVLTKRAERMREYCSTLGRHHEVDRISLAMKRLHAESGYGANGAMYTLGNGGWHFKNVWLGVSAERQQEADERIPHLLQTPAAVRFVSAEPLLGPIDLRQWLSDSEGCGNCGDGSFYEGQRRCCDEPISVTTPGLDWVIVGGESGPNARPMHPDWPRSIRDQCTAAGVAYFFKQWGEWKNGSNFHRDAKAVLLDGRIVEPTHEGMLAAQREASIWNPTLMRRVGKKAAGRLLDGREHSEFPRATP